MISQIEKIILESINANKRGGYFASLYYKVTTRIKEGLQKNEFEDPARMEKMIVLFANRYFAAIDGLKNGSTISASWQEAFNGGKKFSPIVLQHLLLSMNAHINLDLGIVAAENAGNQNIQNIRRDFDNINTIIGSLVFEVINELNKVSPLLSLFGLHAGNESILIQFSITNARDGAWSFSESLHLKKGAEFDACITARDETIRNLGPH